MAPGAWLDRKGLLLSSQIYPLRDWGRAAFPVVISHVVAQWLQRHAIHVAVTLVIRVALAACAKSKMTIKTKGTVQTRARSRCVEATECVRYLAPVQEMLPLLLPSMEGILRCSSLEGKQRVFQPSASFRAMIMTAFITLIQLD